jgi:hypothetical protein
MTFTPSSSITVKTKGLNVDGSCSLIAWMLRDVTWTFVSGFARLGFVLARLVVLLP